MHILPLVDFNTLSFGYSSSTILPVSQSQASPGLSPPIRVKYAIFNEWRRSADVEVISLIIDKHAPVTKR